MKFSTLLVPLFLLFLLFTPSPIAALTCSDVIKDIRPCINYLKSGSGMPPAACCSGASTLAAAVPSAADKRAACTCLQSASKSMNVNPSLTKALPGNCGINLGFTIDPNLDCSKIS